MPCAYTVDSVVSKDGTRIGYRRYGSVDDDDAAAVVLLNGAVGTTAAFHDLASHLAAAHYIVYVPERRGRPLSPCAYTAQHSIARDVEDVQAVLARSDARLLFGLSSGAVIALEAARTLGSAALDQVISYEAPLYAPPQQMRIDYVQRYFDHVRQRRPASAMLNAALASGLAPSFAYRVPQLLLVPLLAAVLFVDAALKRFKPAARRSAPLRDMIPTMQFDYNVVCAMQSKQQSFSTIKDVNILLLSGSNTAAYMRTSAAHLSTVIPDSTWVEIDGVDHGAPWNGASSSVIAKEIVAFFAGGG